MGENKVNIELVGSTSRLDSALNSAAGKVRTYGTTVKGVFAEINRVAEAANKTFGTFGKIAAAFSSGLILKKLFSLEEFMQVDDAMLRMQANFKMNARELDTFKSKLADMAGSHGENMGEVFGISAKLSKSFKPDDILKIMDASSMASHAMGEDLSTVEERIVQIMKMYRKTPSDAKSIAQALVASGTDMTTLDTLLQRGILKGGAGKDYQDILALAGALKKAGAESPRVVMGIESIINAIEDRAPSLKKVGVDLFKVDPKTGKKVKKDFLEILRDLEPVLKSARSRLGEEAYNKATDETFGAGAHEALPFLYSQRGEIQKAKEEQSNAAQIAAARAAKAEESWGHQLEKIKGSLATIKTDLSWIYDLAKKPVKFFADHPGLTKGVGYGAAGLSLAALGGIAYGKGGEFLKNLNLGKTAVGIAEGKAVEAATGVTPVFVTNWPGSMTVGGLPTDVVNKTGVGARIGKIATTAAAALATPAGMGATLAVEALGGAAYWKAANDEAAGLRRWRTENPFDYAKSQEVMGVKPVNHITLQVNMDARTGRVTTTSDDLNTKINVRRGSFLDDIP